ncbi:bifunctional methyltransferase/pyrophosphohydrolase YabN [Halanaerobaculum tunisiense]
MLQIVGLGPGELKLLTLEVYRTLRQADKLYFRTEFHPAVEELKTEGISIVSFDDLYEEAEEFAEVYQGIAEQITSLVQAGEDVVYAVPGHPLVAESSVQQIISQLEESQYEILAGPSFVDAIFTSLNLDPITGVKVIDALEFTSRDLDPATNTIISQVYNRFIASDVKLKLMEVYSDQFPIKVLHKVGLKEERIVEVPLYRLDHLDWIDHLTFIYIPIDDNNCTQLNKLVETMEILRSDQGCPWDQKQDYQTLKKYLIEETYEVIERIEEEDYFGLAEELGDLLLQVVFQSQIAKEEGKFTIRDVIAEIVEKLIRRHPHVFGEVEVTDEQEVMENWRQIKQENKATEDHLLEEVPNQFPALLQAQQLQDKASEVGFDWPSISGALEKVTEELEEFKEARDNDDRANMKEELGDLLFAVVNVARFLEIDAETSLRDTIQKFKDRFAYLEDQVDPTDYQLKDLSLSELDSLWQEAKQKLQEGKQWRN